MPLTSTSTVADGEAQYFAALPWQNSLAAAQSALDAIRFLMVKRASSLTDAGGAALTLETLESEKAALEKFVGVTPRAFGRSRRNTAAFSATEGVG